MNKLILRYALVALCIVAAAVVAAFHSDGWGWFLFFAFLAMCEFK